MTFTLGLAVALVFVGEDLVNASFAVIAAVWNSIVILALAAPTWLWLQRTRTTQPASAVGGTDHGSPEAAVADYAQDAKR